MQFEYSPFKLSFMKTFLILLFCTIGFQSFSQIEFANVTFSGGVGPSLIFGHESWDGPVLGVQVNVASRLIEMNKNASVNAGLGVSFQGSAWDTGDFDGTTRLIYLNIPVLFNYNVSEDIYAEIGLQPGFLLSAKDKYDGMSEDYSDYVNGFELGLPFGAGYKINEQLTVGGRATLGITNLYAEDDSDEADHNFIIVAIVKYILDLN